MEQWFLYALIATVSWGVGQTFVKKGYANISPFYNSLLMVLMCLLFWVPFSLINGANLQNIKFFPTAFLVLLIAFGYQIYYYALAKGQLSLTGTVIAIYPLFAVILARIFLQEVTSFYQNIAIFLILLGVFLMALPNQDEFRKGLTDKSWLRWGLAAAILVGICELFTKIAVTEIGTYNFLLLLTFSYIPAVLMLFFIDKNGRKLPNITLKQFLPAILGIFMIEVSGFIPSIIAFSLGPVSLISPLSSFYIVITVILSILFLKEKISKTQLGGIILSTIGIILLGVS